MVLDGLQSPLISGVLVAASLVLVLVVTGFLTRRFLRLIESTAHMREDRRQQLVTLVQILRWGITVLVVGAAVLMALSYFVDITPLLASVGVVGLAISLGAQTLIKDLIGGFLIVVENQYAVGDSIRVGSVSGQVERLTLRATYLRDMDGSLHIVPNGEARVVSNLTKDWSRATVDVGVAYEEDLDRALHVLEGVAQEFGQDPDFKRLLVGQPQILGPLSLGDWAITVRVMVNTKPGKHWQVARELRKRILATCEREGVSLPYPRQEVLVRNLGDCSKTEQPSPDRTHDK